MDSGTYSENYSKTYSEIQREGEQVMNKFCSPFNIQYIGHQFSLNMF